MSSLALAVLLAASAAAAAERPAAGKREAARARWQAGVAGVLADDRDGARLEWELCLQLDPANRDCRAGLRLLGASPGESAGAGADRRARADELALRAVAEFERGDHAAAYRSAMDCLALDPGNRTAQSVQRLARHQTRGAAGPAPCAGPSCGSEERPPASEDDRRAADSAPPPCGGGSEYPTIDPRAASGRSAAPPGCAAAAPPIMDDARREAIRHWGQGLLHFQKGAMAKARDEWQLCRQYDPDNADCLTGLQRIDGNYGGAP